MRKVELTVKENLKYLTIKKLVETNGNKKRASIKLGCTVRHIDRKIAGYKEKGYDCNYTVFTEFLAERENIFLSIDEVRLILRDKYILSPRSHKSTRKRLRKQLLLEQKRAKSKFEKKKYKLILLLLKMHILNNLDVNILEKRYKWMLAYTFGLATLKQLYTELLMIQLVI